MPTVESNPVETFEIYIRHLLNIHRFYSGYMCLGTLHPNYVGNSNILSAPGSGSGTQSYKVPVYHDRKAITLRFWGATPKIHAYWDFRYLKSPCTHFLVHMPNVDRFSDWKWPRSVSRIKIPLNQKNHNPRANAVEWSELSDKGSFTYRHLPSLIYDGQRDKVNMIFKRGGAREEVSQLCHRTFILTIFLAPSNS